MATTKYSDKTELSEQMDMTMKSLTDFLKATYPRCIPVALEKGTKKPYSNKIITFEFAIDKVTDEEMWRRWDTVGLNLVENGDCDIGISIRDHWIVVDIDSKDIAEHMLNVQEFKDTVTVRTEKGCHIYFERHEECDDWFTAVRPFSVRDLIQPIDIITKYENGTGAIITIPPSAHKSWINQLGKVSMAPVPCSFIEWAEQWWTHKDNNNRIVKNKKVPDNPVEFEKLKRIVMALSDKRADAFQDWRNVCWAIMNISEENGFLECGEDLVHDFSARCDAKYRARDVDKFIRYTNYRGDGFNIGTLMKLLKQDDVTLFDELVTSKYGVNIKGYAFLEEEEEEINLFDGVVRPYRDIKYIFEKTRFKVMHPICYCEEVKDDALIIRPEKEFIKAYRNLSCRIVKKKLNRRTNEEVEMEETKPFVTVWMDDPLIKTYQLMDVYPPPLTCPPKVYNVWNGFAVERFECESSGNIEPFMEHMKLIVRGDEKGLDYLIKWFAQMFQEPGKLVGTAPIIRGDQGTGKSSILDEGVKRMLGHDKYYSTPNPTKDLFSQFSDGRFGKLMVVVDETKSKDSINNLEVMKAAITSPTYNHEVKSVTPMRVRNFNRFVFTSNQDAPVKIEAGDRRYFMFDMDPAKYGDKEYFDALMKYMSDERNLKAIYEYMMSIDISNVNWINDRPITETYDEVRAESVDVVTKFLINAAQQLENSTEPAAFYGEQLYNVFTRWCLINNEVKKGLQTEVEAKISIVAFGTKMGRIAQDATCGVIKRKTGGKTKYELDAQQMKEYFTKRRLYNLEYYFKHGEFLGVWRGE